MAPSTVEAAAKKGRVRIRARVAKKILAVHPTLDNLPDWARIDATGTRRRLQALMVAGWSAQVLASRLEMDRNTIRKILLADVVRVSTARAVRNLFRVMWNRQPPSELRYERASVTRTRAYAARQGWAPAAAWDDIDNPKCRPKGVPRRETPLDTPAQTAA
ncbi:hypothetical protein AB0395_21865 [Streptosporangium sp. NPDC051023]|uniref:hypothetical protein n=1 Tax=Streptosporangium sp. NPDC051023 TaxID=3155410 RepID=UPI00344EC46C